MFISFANQTHIFGWEKGSSYLTCSTKLLDFRDCLLVWIGLKGSLIVVSDAILTLVCNKLNSM